MDKPKMNKKTITIAATVAGVIALIAIIWYFVAKSNKTKNNPGAEIEETDIDKAFFPLQKGDNNDYVTLLQEYLVDKGGSLPNYGIDGDFGSETAAALKNVLGVDSVSYDLFTKKIV